MSIRDTQSTRKNVCPKPFSPMGLIIIGVLVLGTMVLWERGPSVATLALLPLMLICSFMHFFTHNHRN
jgi:hypothetical protein